MRVNLVFFILFLANHLWAQDYLMPQLVLKKNLEDHDEINSPVFQNHCQGRNSYKEESGFEATIKCRFSCLNSNIIEEESIQNFSTEKLQMQPGDGNLWASLTTTIQMWSGETCLKIAQNKCSGLKNISTFSQPEISSGDWKLDSKLGCSPLTKETFSPFEKTIKAKKSIFSHQVVPGELEIKTSWHDIKKVTHGGKKYTMPKGCRNILKGTFCYGDCITLDKGPFKELLGSPAPLGQDHYEICADELVTKIKNKKLSKDILQFYCDDFFLYSLKKKNATGLTCASSRFNADCSNLKF